MAALLARLGTSDPVEPVDGFAPLIQGIDFGRFGRAPARFDIAELASLNAKMLHHLSYDVVAARLPQGMKEAAWDVIRPNLTQISEAAVWWRIVTGPVDSESVPEDTEFLVAAARIAARIDWNANPWHALTNALKAETDRKGKELFLPLRRALTGLDHGPDMAALLPLIGRTEALNRLSV